MRQDSAYRSWLTSDGSPGPSGEGGFPAAPGRYHPYVSYACPWAHRTLIMSVLKGLGGMIDISVVNWVMLDHGWTFDDAPRAIADLVHGAR